MNNQPAIFILSNNRDFIEPFSSIVTRELKIACKAITSESELQEENIALLVTSQPLVEKHLCPIIEVKLPIYINKLLADIDEKLISSKNMDTLDIASDWQLSLQHKIFTHKPSGCFASLTDKESHLLQEIAKSGEEGISREFLMKKVWNIDSALDTHTLETHIYRLRKKIKDVFDSEMIKAIEGGYRL